MHADNASCWSTGCTSAIDAQKPFWRRRITRNTSTSSQSQGGNIWHDARSERGIVTKDDKEVRSYFEIARGGSDKPLEETRRRRQTRIHQGTNSYDEHDA